MDNPTPFDLTFNISDLAFNNPKTKATQAYWALKNAQ